MTFLALVSHDYIKKFSRVKGNTRTCTRTLTHNFTISAGYLSDAYGPVAIVLLSTGLNVLSNALTPVVAEKLRFGWTIPLRIMLGVSYVRILLVAVPYIVWYYLECLSDQLYSINSIASSHCRTQSYYEASVRSHAYVCG